MEEKFALKVVQNGQTKLARQLRTGAGANGQALVVKAEQAASYQLVNQVTLTSPAKLQFKRKGDDLHVSLPGGDTDMPDLVIENYFAVEGSAIKGISQNGEWQAYDTSVFVPKPVAPGDKSAKAFNPDSPAAVALGEAPVSALVKYDSPMGLAAIGGGALALGTMGKGGGSGGGSPSPSNNTDALSVIKSYAGASSTAVQPTAAQYTAAGVYMLGLTGLVVWAYYGTIDQVTRAQAQVIAQARTQLVQSSDGGVLTQLHVKEGDSVKAGQLLATLQKERAAAAVSDSNAKVAALRITLTRLHAEVYGKPLSFDRSLLIYTDYIRNQTDLYNKRQTAFKDDIAALENILALSEDELRINRQLEASGDVSRAEILRLQRSVADIKAQLAGKRNKYFQDAQAEMTKAQEDLSTQIEQLKDRNQVLEHTELLAPVDAVVNNIKVNTLGGVVRAGETVMELLPSGDNLVVEAKIPPADIAFVALDQPTSVKLDAYDSSIYGSMRGHVSYISPDVLTEETKQGPMSFYRVRVTITGKEFKGHKAEQIKLRPGLTATVEIKALDRTVLSYLTKPITKTLNQSMGER